MTALALILKALIKCVIYPNECVNIIGTSSSQFLKHFNKEFLTEHKIENVLSPELLGLNVEKGQEYAYKAKSSQEKKVPIADLPLLRGRYTQLDSVLLLYY